MVIFVNFPRIIANLSLSIYKYIFVLSLSLYIYVYYTISLEFITLLNTI